MKIKKISLLVALLGTVAVVESSIAGFWVGKLPSSPGHISFDSLSLSATPGYLDFGWSGDVDSLTVCVKDESYLNDCRDLFFQPSSDKKLISAPVSIIDAEDSTFFLLGNKGARKLKSSEKAFSGDLSGLIEKIEPAKDLDDERNYGTTGAAALDDLLVVGAKNDKVGTSKWQGSVRVLIRDKDTANWVETQKLLQVHDPVVYGSGDFFGARVTINKDGVLVVSAPGADGPWGTAFGRIYIYKKEEDSTFTLEKQVSSHEIGLTGADIGEDFGGNIDVDDDGNILVTAVSSTTNGLHSGNAGLLQKHNGSWELRQLLPDDNAYMDHFGSSIAVDGDIAVVGAKGPGWHYTQHEWDGSLYIYEGLKQNNIRGNIPYSKIMPEKGVGTVIEVSDGVIFAGIPDNFKDGDPGSVLVIDKSSGSWSVKDTLIPQVGTSFGNIVKAENGTLVITSSSHLYIYKLDDTGAWKPLKIFDLVADLGIGAEVTMLSFRDNRLLIGYQNSSISGLKSIYLP